jgi:hypothetical protein
MERRCFNSEEAAERHLEMRKKTAFKRIEKRGEKVLYDNSFVHTDFLGKTNKKGDLKWTTFLGIVTDKMVEDIKNFQPLDVQAIEAEMMKKISQDMDNEIIKRCFELGQKQFGAQM